MVKSCYQRLYDSSIAYGMKKALVAEQRKTDMQNRILMLEKESRDVDEHCEQMEEYIERVQRESAHEREARNREHEAAKHEMR